MIGKMITKSQTSQLLRKQEAMLRFGSKPQKPIFSDDDVCRLITGLPRPDRPTTRPDQRSPLPSRG